MAATEEPQMIPDDPLSRRVFLAPSSIALGVVVLGLAVASPLPVPPARLTLHGGAKGVGYRPPKLVRGGEPEKQRLDARLGQLTRFYCNSLQSTFLLFRFRKTCSLPH